MKLNLKKVISSVAALAMSLSCFTAFAADFSDVEATASYKTAIDTLVALEIVNGYEDGSFKPENEITRGEVTKMVVAAMGPSYTAAAESSKGNSGFSDVDAVNHWASGYISVGVAQSFINGMGDGTFAPDANVTYAQIVKMLVAALGYTSSAELAGGYPNGYIQTANQIGVTEGISGINGDTNVTRAQVAQLIANSLDIPLVTVTDWTTNILTGEPVAVTEIQDGIGKGYKTLLTEFHDAYVVKGRVQKTQASGGMDAGVVEFNIEYADNFLNEHYNVKDGNYGDYAIEAFVGDTNAADLIFTYSEALIQVNEDEEATILVITPYGKNEIITVSADLYDGPEAASAFAGAPVADNPATTATNEATDGVISFRVSETSAKTKDYVLAPDAKIYVNGAEGSWATDVDAYIDGNSIGNVTLIDAPEAGKPSKDGKIDYIMVDYAEWAIVDDVLVEDETATIYFSNSQAGNYGFVVDFEDVEEGLFSYTIEKDGAEIALEDLKKDDVLLLTYDVLSGLATSKFVNVVACDKVVEGQVTGFKNGKYTIAGEQFELATGVSVAGLAVTEEFTVYVDAAGRIVKGKQLASSAKYGIIDRAAIDLSTEEEYVRIIKADGTIEKFGVVTTGATNWYTTAQGIAYGAGNDDTDPLQDVSLRVVKYKTNASGKINYIDDLFASTQTPATGEYKERTNRIGNSIVMDDATYILDLTAVYAISGTAVNNRTAYDASDIKAGSLATFVDGEQYTVIAGAEKVDGKERFVIVTAGNATLNATTAFAVVNGAISSAMNDAGMSVQTLEVFEPGSKDAQVYEINEDYTAPVVAEGDIVVLKFAADGTVVQISKLFQNLSSYANDPRTGSASKYMVASITAWDSTTILSNNWARTGFGYVVDKTDSSIVVINDANGDGYAANADGEINDIVIAEDANVYEIDLTARAGYQVSVSAKGAISKTYVKSAAFDSANNKYDLYATSANMIDAKLTSVYYKITNDEITDIVIVKVDNPYSPIA